MIEIVHPLKGKVKHFNILFKFLRATHAELNSATYYTCPDCDDKMVVVNKYNTGYVFFCTGCLTKWFKAESGGYYKKLKEFPKRWRKENLK